MTEAKAKKHLRGMLLDFTAGTVAHLLSEVFREMAEEAHRQDDDLAVKQFQEVAATLFVMGLGIDATCPQK